MTAAYRLGAVLCCDPGKLLNQALGILGPGF